MASSPPNAVVAFHHTITHLGGAEIDDKEIEVTSTSGWVVNVYAADGLTPLPDTDADGHPEVGPLAIGEQREIVVAVTVPADAVPGTQDVMTVTASSVGWPDPANEDTVTDVTTVLAPPTPVPTETPHPEGPRLPTPTVETEPPPTEAEEPATDPEPPGDAEPNATPTTEPSPTPTTEDAAPTPTEAGEPEPVSPVVTLGGGEAKEAPPGATVEYAHEVTNHGTAPLVLWVAAGSLHGWPVETVDPDGAALPDADGDGNAELGMVGSGQTVGFVVRVTVPADAADGAANIAAVSIQGAGVESALASTVDVTTVRVPPLPAIDLSAGEEREVPPGTDVQYRHVVSADEAPAVVNVAATSAHGWPVALLAADGVTPLADTNGDGVVDVGLVAPGQAVEFVVQVTVPGDAPAETEDVTTVDVTAVVPEPVGDDVGEPAGIETETGGTDDSATDPAANARSIAWVAAAFAGPGPGESSGMGAVSTQGGEGGSQDQTTNTTIVAASVGLTVTGDAAFGTIAPDGQVEAGVVGVSSTTDGSGATYVKIDAVTLDVTSTGTWVVYCDITTSNFNEFGAGTLQWRNPAATNDWQAFGVGTICASGSGDATGVDAVTLDLQFQVLWSTSVGVLDAQITFTIEETGG